MKDIFPFKFIPGTLVFIKINYDDLDIMIGVCVI